MVNVLLSGEDCHWILPVLPLRLIDVELPVHKVLAVAVAVPPREAGLTVIVAVVELAEAHTPLVTTAR